MKEQRQVQAPQSGLHFTLPMPKIGSHPNATYAVTKRALDLLLSLIALPLVLPISLLVAVLIRLDSPGPILFVHRRVGKGGRWFNMFKFRTMIANAQELQADLAHLNEQCWPSFKISNDPRVTRVGRLLRKTSLDELPQILNILKGDMSWVGPRPHSWDPKDYHYAWQQERLAVTPGLTGLGQVAGRCELSVDEEIQLDLEYIKHRSIRLDLDILVKTVIAVLKQQGAY